MAYLPVFTIKTVRKTVLVALLLGIEFVSQDHVPWSLGLLLRATTATSPDPARPLYATTSGQYPLAASRLCKLPLNPLKTAAGRGVRVEWRTIHIVHSEFRTLKESPKLQALGQSLRAPFHIPHSHIMDLLRCPGVTFDSFNPPIPADPSFKWQQMVLTFKINGMLCARQEASPAPAALNIDIRLGLCTRGSGPHGPEHWAMISGRKTRPDYLVRRPGDDFPMPLTDHVCAEHHVDLQPVQTKSFAVQPHQRSLASNSSPIKVRVKLSFKPYALNPTHVRTLHIEFDMAPIPSQDVSPSCRLVS